MNSKLQKVIDNHDQWYENFNAMRNLVTHWGDLLNFKSTTHKPAIDQEFARIFYPQMPDKKKVTRYMTEVWNKSNISTTFLSKDQIAIIEKSAKSYSKNGILFPYPLKYNYSILYRNRNLDRVKHPIFC